MSRLLKTPAETPAPEERAANRLRAALNADSMHVDDAARARVRSASDERAARRSTRARSLRPLAYSLAGAAALVAVAAGVFIGTESTRPSLTAAAVAKRAIAVMERLPIDPDTIVHDVVVEHSIAYDKTAEDPDPLEETTRYESWRAVGGGTERVVEHETRYDGYETTRTVILSGGRHTTITEEGGSTQVDSGSAAGSLSATHYRFAGPCSYCHPVHSEIVTNTPELEQAQDWDDGGRLYRWLLENDKLTLAGTKSVDGHVAWVLHAEDSEVGGTASDGSDMSVKYQFDIFVDRQTFRLLGYEYGSSSLGRDGTELASERRSLRIESSELLSREELPPNLFSHEVEAGSAVHTGSLEPNELAGFAYQPVYWFGADPSPAALLPEAKELGGVAPDTVLDAVIYIASPRGSMSATDSVTAFYVVYEGEEPPADAPAEYEPARVARRVLAVVTRTPGVHEAYLGMSLDGLPSSYRLVSNQVAGHRVDLRYQLREGETANSSATATLDDSYVFSGRVYVEFPDAVVELYDTMPSFATTDDAEPVGSLTEADIERLVPLLERAN